MISKPQSNRILVSIFQKRVPLESLHSAFQTFIKGTLPLIFFSPMAMASQLSIGLVLDKGGKDDKSFNASAYAGVLRAEKDFKIKFKYVEATDTNAFEGLHRSFARKKTDLIIGIGFSQLEAVKKISAQFPDQKFVLVDGELNAPNVKSLLFEEHEGSFLVGAVAALKSKSNQFGFIGGMDIPLIRRFHLGYEAGVKHIKPKAEVIQQYIGITGEAWNNPTKAKELALAQYNRGVEVIYVAAGASGTGVFDAAEDKRRFAIGVDSNQNWVKPGFVLTSMMKRVDNSVYDAIRELSQNQFKSGVFRFGLKNQGIEVAVDEHNKNLLPPDLLKKVEALKADILSGKIQVPDYYKLKR